MAKDTTRDRLWKFALVRTHTTDGTITTSRLEEISGASTRSCRDVLETMSNYGILVSERDGNGRVYHANPNYFIEHETRELTELEEEQ